ncbi:MAG: M13 family metallopeptidase [Clostridium sp.]|nr:M13 family metallopeptidase [Prevotella sp.]MCM1428728.1 M13 family metallopeptidase [Clostridium sp.]MCM1475103.1 M13 family metallopeptidase [Muribaculaceae bacterium]
MKHLKVIALGLLAGVALSATAEEHLKSLDPKSIDPSYSPKSDFYHYVNNGWMQANPLTPEHSRYGKFNILTDSSQNRVRRIVTGLAATKPEPGTLAYKVAALYEGGMDSVRRNQLGATPILADLKKIETTDAAGMEDLFLWMHKEISNPFFSAAPQEDIHNSQRYAMYVGGGGMTLGDRDYYLKQDKENKRIREAYKKLIITNMQNAGYSKKDASRIAKNVLKIETLLADSAWTREQSRNMLAMDNPRSFQQLTEMYPNLPFGKFFPATMGINDVDTVYVTEINSVKQADNLMRTLSNREKKDYYLWLYVNQAAPYLSDNFSNAEFEFEKIMRGVEQQEPRWKRALSTTENFMGEAVGELYVKEYFPESSKRYMEGLVDNLRNALAKHIMHLPWMSDDTKVQAMKKLNAITVKIGYPDKWKDYTTLVIDPSLSYYENVHNAGMWASQDYLSRWGKPVDRSMWHMTPQTVNAYYNPMNNEIVFPAGILQAPFFDPESSDAENYGGIGVVIGHELTHGFDDQGCNFDANGNMENWWTPEDAEAFAKLTQGLADQYSAVEVLPGLHANGQYTLGENIADQGGLRIALTAFLDAQKKKGVDINAEEAKIEGYTPMQVYYMNFANLWGQNVRDQEIRKLTMGDPHSLGINRVNVAIRNIAPFFEAFGIEENDPMYRPESERVIIW